MRVLWIAIMWIGACVVTQGQEKEQLTPHLVIVDDIQIDLKDIYLSPKGDTAIVELFLISLQKNPREFKMNSFASGMTDSKGKPFLYSTMEMGKIRLDIADRQNYLHYLMEQDLPVLLRIRTAGWSKQWGKPQQAKLTFEESTEEGKFLEIELNF